MTNPANSNLNQIEHWNGPMGRLWASRCTHNEYRLAHIQAALMAFAAPEPGMEVLDIGCGCGLTTLALAEAVRPGGVVGLDVSAPLLEVARGAASEAGLDVSFVESDASIYPFRPDFDLVFSRFGVMFFADPVAAFANIRGALKPGGRLVFACWRRAADNPWTFVPFESVRDLLPPQPAAVPGAPGQFAFADGDRVNSILERAGFAGITVERRDIPVNLGKDIEEATAEALAHGMLAHALTALDESTQQSLRGSVFERVRAALTPYVTADGVAPPGSIWLVGASSP